MDPSEWPLFGLRITTPRLELRLPTDHDLAGQLTALRAGIHNDEPYPFWLPWSLDPEPQRTWNALKFHWRCRAEFSPDAFDLPFAVVIDGEIAGTQGLRATDFRRLRTVDSGSWLARPWQGNGYGLEMRAALLTFAFEHLGAACATSGARTSNVRSIAVSRRLGYRDNGQIRQKFGHDDVGEELMFRLDRDDWARVPDKPHVEIAGWDECRAMFELD